MGHFTLLIDESGKFEPATRERAANVLGGVLVPGSAESLHSRWAKPLADKCAELGVAPHSTDLSREDRAALRALIGREVKQAGGCWLFLVANPQADGGLELPFALYLRVLGSFVELAARVASLRGATHLHVRPAQRTVPVTDEELEAMKRLGMLHEKKVQVDALGAFSHRATALVQSDVRLSVDALRLEGANAPVLASVDVV